MTFDWFDLSQVALSLYLLHILSWSFPFQLVLLCFFLFFFGDSECKMCAFPSEFICTRNNINPNLTLRNEVLHMGPICSLMAFYTGMTFTKSHTRPQAEAEARQRQKHIKINLICIRPQNNNLQCMHAVKMSDCVPKYWLGAKYEIQIVDRCASKFKEFQMIFHKKGATSR